MIKRHLFRSPLLLLGVALLAPFLPLLLAPGGRVYGHSICDNPSMFYYINAFAGHCWRQGVIPLWNPHIMLGLPFLGEGQAALFHPLSWLFILLPTGVAINWLIALSFLLTGLFFYGYLRALELGRTAACYGALVWCYSNVLIMRLYAGHLTNLLEFIEMPLMLLLWERYRRTGRIQYLSGIALAYAAMILAAHPQFLYIFSLFFLVYVLLQSGLEIAARRGARAAAAREALGTIARLGVFILLGIGIGAVQLLPSIDFAAESFRQKATIEFCGMYSFEPENLLTLLVPRFFGIYFEPQAGIYWGRGFFWEMVCYFGILPLLLALAGLAAAPWRRRVTLGACALIFFLVALGRFTPLFPLIYHYIPFFNVFRGPSKNMLMTELCLVTLSAFGVQALLRPAGGDSGRRRLLAGLLGGGLALGLVLALYLYFIPGSAQAGSHWRQFLLWNKVQDTDNFPPPFVRDTAGWAAAELGRSAIFLMLSLGVLALAWSGKWRRALPALVFAVTLGDLLFLFLPLLDTYDEGITRYPEELVAPLSHTIPPPRVLAGGLMPNIAMLHGFSSPSGYTGNTLTRYNHFITASQKLDPTMPQLFNPISNYLPAYYFLGIEGAILPQGDQPKNTPPSAAGRVPAMTLVRAPQPFPRAWLAAQPRPFDSADKALQYVLTPGAPLLASPAVETTTVSEIPPAPLGAAETVKFVSFTPTRVELEASAAQSRVLVLGEMFEKNWTATVDGRAAPVFPANYLFRGIRIPAGASRVVFAYRPAAFRWGATLSLLSLAAVLGLGLWAGRRRQPVPPAGPAAECVPPDAAPTPKNAPRNPGRRPRTGSRK